MTGDAECARSAVGMALAAHLLSRDAMARALVWRYENTASFDQARANVGYLRMIPAAAWTPALKEQARAVPEPNYQVVEAWYGERDVPNAVADPSLTDQGRRRRMPPAAVTIPAWLRSPSTSMASAR